MLRLVGRLGRTIDTMRHDRRRVERLIYPHFGRGMRSPDGNHRAEAESHAREAALNLFLSAVQRRAYRVAEVWRRGGAAYENCLAAITLQPSPPQCQPIRPMNYVTITISQVLLNQMAAA